MFRIGAFLFLTLALALALALPLAAIHPNQPQGYSSERSYQEGLGGIDQIDLYSGRLSLTVPVGPFTLYYNNNVWRYENVVEKGTPRVKATPDRLTTAGLGWHLGWGELYHPSHWYNPTEMGQWLYVGKDGKRHVFYDRLHHDDPPDGDADVHYTRDNSYLRLRKVSTWAYDIEFPDGSKQRFANQGSLSSKPFRLAASWSSFSSFNDPDMEITYNVDDTLRTVTDRYGRNHYIHLAKDTDLIDGYPVSWMVRLITHIDAEGFQGQRNLYDLKYRNILVSVSCKDSSSTTDLRIRIPHLTEIHMIDEGTSFTMLDGATPAYANLCQANLDDVPGSLERIDLPTGGALRWAYQQYEFPPGNNWSVFNTAAGVATREMIEADGAVAGTWTYKSRNFGATKGADPEVRMDVVAPDGDCSRHYFNAIYYVLPSQQKGWELGMPFVYRESSGGKFLSSEIYPSNNGNGLCTGAKLRTSYVRYRHDATPGCVYDPSDPGSFGCPRQSAFYDVNRTVEASRVVFHDDSDRWVDSESSDFDGIGNFRETVTTGNFWSPSSTQERRQTRIEFNRVAGTYGQSGYAPPTTTTPWVLGLYSSSQVTENDAEGESVARMEISMDPTTGAMECRRVLTSGTTRQNNDLLTTYDYDSLGFLIHSKSYGSDRQPIPTTGAGCGTLPAASPQYWVTSTHQYGVLKTTRPRRPGGINGLYYTHDVELDPSTGLVTASRDSAGFTTNLQYDALGRLEEVTTGDGSLSTIQYVNASGTTPSKIVTTVRSAKTSEIFGKSETVFDAFGRATLERRLLPGNVWSEKETLRSARGWVQSVTQWGNPNLKTHFLEYDALGRPGRIRPADGAGHDLTMSYLGSRKTTVSYKAQQVIGAAEGTVTRSSSYDRYGRVRQVLEGAGVAGANVATTFRYDVGGRVTRIFQGSAPQQTRRFDYDNRGFLLRERNPEKGGRGNGWTTYQGFDPVGQPNRVIDGPNDIGMTYDFMGRVLTSFDRNRGNRPVTAIAYDGGVGRGMGKVWKEARFNYVDLPWEPGAEETVQVEHTYNYQGLAGEVSQRDTSYLWPDSTDTFRQSYQYAEDGNVSSQSYPRCITVACAGSSAATSRTVSFDHTLGRLTGIPGWLGSIAYHPNGSWSQIAHTNGVTDHRLVHPQLSTKTWRLFTTGVTQGGTNYNSGQIGYDGAGNIKFMGADSFAYDPAGRLKQANFTNQGVEQAYQYDPFGNLLQRDTTQGGFTTAETFAADSSTNRLQDPGITYDSAGNVTSWNGYTFTYDTENNLTSQAWMRYLYDASNERVAAIPNTPARTVHYHQRDVGNQLVSHVILNNGTFTRERDTIYAGSRMIASVDSAGAARRYHLDHLNSPRLLTNDNGSVFREPFLLPFGEEYPFQDTADNRKFTGHERDYSTGTDYMHARHFNSKTARFLSVDPLAGRLRQPQTLNRYAYVSGNPLNFSDPTGLYQHGSPGDAIKETIDVIGRDPNKEPDDDGERDDPPALSGVPGSNGGGGGGRGGRGSGDNRRTGGRGGAGGVINIPFGPFGGDDGPGDAGPTKPDPFSPNMDLLIPILDVQRARDFYSNHLNTSTNGLQIFALETMLTLLPETQSELLLDIATTLVPPLKAVSKVSVVLRITKARKLAKAASAAKGQTGRKALTALVKLAKTAGLEIVEGSNYTQARAPGTGKLVDNLPRSPKGTGTVNSIIKNLLKWSADN